MITRWTEEVKRDLYMRKGTSDVTIWENTFVRCEHIPPAYLDPATVLDLGANVGYTAAAYQARWPDARVVAVEMDKGNVTVCKANFSGTVICAAVVLDGPRTRTYNSRVMAASYRLGGGNVEVTALPFEELLETVFGDEIVDFCKMDIEGVEEELISNVSSWASQVRSLLVEVHPYINGYTLEQAWRSLADSGYQVRHVRNDPATLWAAY